VYENSPVSVLAMVPPQIGFSSRNRKTVAAAAPSSGEGSESPSSGGRRRRAAGSRKTPRAVPSLKAAGKPRSGASAEITTKGSGK
jgi:hypothetical protein